MATQNTQEHFSSPTGYKDMIKYITPAFQQNIWFSGSPKVTFRISLNVTFPEPETRYRLWPVQVDFSTGNGDREVWLIVLESLDATLIKPENRFQPREKNYFEGNSMIKNDILIFR